LWLLSVSEGKAINLAPFNLHLLDYNSRNGCLCEDLIIQKINLFLHFQ